MISSNREIRFELIFKAFDEIFKHPDKYDLPKTDFELSVDGFYDSGKDLHTVILSQNDGSFIVTSSEFTVMLPEADQTIFFILKQLTYNNCLIKYKDNDILLSALLNFKGMTSGNSRMYLQNLSSKRVVTMYFK